LLDGIFSVCGVPVEKFRTICSSVDKLDKTPWAEVRQEMVDVKGLAPEIAEKIWTYVQRKGDADLVTSLLQDAELCENKMAREALEDMAILFRYISILGVSRYASFDLSLARGLDYYTGMIMETVLDAADGVGSVAGGGRYDDLVGILSGGHTIPCVGFAFGVERLFAIMEAKMLKAAASSQNPALKISAIDVLVASVGDHLLEARMQLCTELWDAGIAAEYLYKKKPKLLDQFEYCEKNRIPLVVLLGQDELDGGQVRLKMIADREDKGALILRSSLISTLRKYLAAAQVASLPDVSALKF
jgi:histidyl-tRNA synthetase